MYHAMKLKDELRELREKLRKGEADQITVTRVFEIEMILDNLLWYEE